MVRQGLGEKVATGSGRKHSLPVGDNSPVALVRNANANAQKALVAMAAGRCEFPGCNGFLFEHPLTKDCGNYGENAHIVAFKEGAARGRDGARPVDINSIDNLMLLCQPCHKMVDDNPARYSRDFLVAGKEAHERRVRALTELGPELRTNVLVLKSRIGERATEVGQQEVADALRPRYPASTSFTQIDLSQLGDEKDPGYYPMAERLIGERIAAMYAAQDVFREVKHLSVVGLAPMPLLVKLGATLSNAVQTDFFQCHRDRDDRWTWHPDGPPVSYATSVVRSGTDTAKVAVTLSLSGTIDATKLPGVIDDAYTVYEVTLDGALPNPAFLRTRRNLDDFRAAYRALIARITREYPAATELHLFPAVPAPAAIVLGFDLLPKVHPALIVHDFDKRVGGFTERIRVNRNE